MSVMFTCVFGPLYQNWNPAVPVSSGTDAKTLLVCESGTILARRDGYIYSSADFLAWAIALPLTLIHPSKLRTVFTTRAFFGGAAFLAMFGKLYFTLPDLCLTTRRYSLVHRFRPAGPKRVQRVQSPPTQPYLRLCPWLGHHEQHQFCIRDNCAHDNKPIRRLALRQRTEAGRLATGLYNFRHKVSHGLHEYCRNCLSSIPLWRGGSVERLGPTRPHSGRELGCENTLRVVCLSHCLRLPPAH